MKYMPLLLLFILILTGCSQKEVEQKEPPKLEKPVKGEIPEALIQKAQIKYGKKARNRYEAYNAKLRELQDASSAVKLQEINNFFNDVPYVDDSKVWAQKDYWATPLEFLGKDKGDCEDYVIAKYFSLVDLGVDSKKLYFAYVKSTKFTRSHMVLSYFESIYSIPLVLDSINYKIFPADKRKDLIPVYNFNGETLYRARKKGQNGRKVINHIHSERAHRQWDQLLKDIQNNKL
jgi:predicted transglutaminase-like cysteine proteinase